MGVERISKGISMDYSKGLAATGSSIVFATTLMYWTFAALIALAVIMAALAIRKFFPLG